ncbi:MAG: GAP family protein [Actinomycetota bacterium]|nr:GAP family protein [Actinomycetota bacterium]
MIESAAGFAVLAAISPAAILVCAAYLGSASPRRTTLWFLAGAITMTAVIGVIALAALRAGGLSLPTHHSPRYGVRLGLGVLALGGSLFMARRKPAPPNPDQPKKPGLVSRLVSRPGPAAAFAAGILVFIPSASFLAAVQVIATARASVLATGATLAVVVIINVMFVWLPFAFHLVRPEATTRALKALNGSLRAHGHALVAGALLVAGLLLVSDGIKGLV